MSEEKSKSESAEYFKFGHTISLDGYATMPVEMINSR